MPGDISTIHEHHRPLPGSILLHQAALLNVPFLPMARKKTGEIEKAPQSHTSYECHRDPQRAKTYHPHPNNWVSRGNSSITPGWCIKLQRYNKPPLERSWWPCEAVTSSHISSFVSLLLQSAPCLLNVCNGSYWYDVIQTFHKFASRDF